MKLNENELELIEMYRRAKRDNNTNVIISLYAVMDMFLQNQGQERSGRLTGYTRGQYKRAIKAIRTAQALALREGQTRSAEDFDLTVRYIREHCLNRSAVAA